MNIINHVHKKYNEICKNLLQYDNFLLKKYYFNWKIKGDGSQDNFFKCKKKGILLLFLLVFATPVLVREQ